MNIKITYNWLLDYIETDATPEEIGEYLSLCGPSVEKVEKLDDDWVFDIEITTNRIDTASVLGIAQECVAILPQFGKKARLINNPLKENLSFFQINLGENILPIKFNHNKKISKRVALTVLDNISVTSSPLFIQKRLAYCDLKPINNVVDISNYLHIALGQPLHIFDYDLINGKEMILDISNPAETIITLDEKKHILPGNDIVIRDISGKIIDLAGIMGGLNSAVSEKTKRIIIFVPHFEKTYIRKTSMKLSHRTLAATYFEKGLDPERIMPTLIEAVKMFTNNTKATIAYPIIDIYPRKEKTKEISFSIDHINQKIGIEIKKDTIFKILKRLNFTIDEKKNIAIPPSYRSSDITREEDIVEEVARIYGYNKLPSKIPVMPQIEQPENFAKIFEIKNELREILASIGFHEVYTYSMISPKTIENIGEDKNKYIRIKNPVNDDLSYMRKSLIPSLCDIYKKNFGKHSPISLFEIARVYFKNDSDLPIELEVLSFISDKSYEFVKGTLDLIFKKCNIKKYNVEIIKSDSYNLNARYYIDTDSIATIGLLSQKYANAFEIKNKIFFASINLESLIKYRKPNIYKPIPKYAKIYLDLTYTFSPKLLFSEIEKKSFKISSLLKSIEFVSIFKNKITLRFFFQDDNKNITEKEAINELKKIKKIIGFNT